VDDATEKTRKPRADSLRNREHLLATAKSVFTEAGTDAALEEIARRAEVGIGTLYRHFPTRGALLAAVYQREVEHLSQSADRLLAEKPPVEALELWFEELIAYMATKRVVVPALKADPGEGAKAVAAGGPTIHETFARLVAAGAKAGAMRAGLEIEDLHRLLVGFAHGYDQPGWEPAARRLAAILIAGLRSWA